MITSQANMNGDIFGKWKEAPVPEKVKDPDTYKAARGFESYFARYLTKEMGKSMNMIGGKGLGGEMYQGMLTDAMGEQIALKGGLGITDMIYRQLMQQSGEEPYKTQELSNDIEGKIRTVQTNVPTSEERKLEKLPSHLIKYSHLVHKAAEKYDLDPELVFAVINQESAGDHTVVSHAGAKGLMQLIDSTAAEMGVKDPYNPQQNIEGGTKYLKKQIDEFGDVELALAAYNAGPNAVKKYNGVPPYKETQNYVKKVQKYFAEFKSITKKVQEIRNEMMERSLKRTEESINVLDRSA